jgi:hypothetical protein
MRKRTAACVVASALVGIADRGVAADEKLVCVTAADAAQQHRAAGKLLEARAQLAICSRDICPGLVRADCTRWRAEVEGSIPTIVFRAQDSKGQDLTDVKVWLDGAPITDKIDGLPIEIDPGQHQLSGEHLGSRKLQKEIVIRTGDRNRTISLSFEDVETLPPEVRIPPPPAPARPSPAAWVFSGVGVAAAGVGTYFLVSAIRDRDALRRDPCAQTKTCPQSAVDAGQRKADFATVGYGAAIVSAGIATYFFLTPSRPKSTTLPSREVLVTPLHGGAVATWTERF